MARVYTSVRRKKTQPARAMSRCARAWMAALIDSEGYVQIRFNEAAGRRTSGRLIIVNACLPLLERVRAVTGTGTISRREKLSGQGKKPCYDWFVSGRVTCDIAVQIAPWMIVKRQTVEQLIALPIYRNLPDDGTNMDDRMGRTGQLALLLGP